MEKINLLISIDELGEKVLPLLLDNVFHVTSGENFNGIKQTGSINANKNAVYPHTFPQSKCNFGARKGMVCLVDLRGQSFDQAKEIAEFGYYFLCPKNDWTEIVFLLLKSDCYSDLKLQAGFNPPREGEQYVDMKDVTAGTYVPKIECWYLDKITLEKIDKAVVVKFHAH